MLCCTRLRIDVSDRWLVLKLCLFVFLFFLFLGGVGGSGWWFALGNCEGVFLSDGLETFGGVFVFVGWMNGWMDVLGRYRCCVHL